MRIKPMDERHILRSASLINQDALWYSRRQQPAIRSISTVVHGLRWFVRHWRALMDGGDCSCIGVIPAHIALLEGMYYREYGTPRVLVDLRDEMRTLLAEATLISCTIGVDNDG